jgi:hypothetical protein
MLPVRVVPRGELTFVNRTLTVQDAPGASVAPVHVSAPDTALKNQVDMLPPETPTLVTNVEVPPAGEALVKVTTPVPVPEPVAKVIKSGFGEIDTVALVLTPVPVRLTGRGVTVSPEDVTESVRLYDVAAVGVKTTLMVQEAPIANAPPAPLAHVPPAAPFGLENG